MKLLHYDIKGKSRSDVFTLYPIGDLHLGARDCAEKHFRRFVNRIAPNPNARWIGGGDYLECIKPQDIRRFDFDNIPNWILSEPPEDIKEALRDIVRAQRRRFTDIVQPIKKRCIGLIEGNHEFAIQKYHNHDIQNDLCYDIGAENLTTEAIIRLAFHRGSSCKVITLFITHGHGGGRTAGSEPNKLAQLTGMFDTDLILRGHSHQFCILPPDVRLTVPRKGKLPNECQQRIIRSANWGCWRKSYAAGASTYTSRALYKPRTLTTLEIKIKPFNDSGPIIQMNEANFQERSS